ncbi:MAG TPA: (Fe-S)-binding protein [Actinomycetes bacterium]|nr:(Fe-S)-binding protein [Actinomycetes bacterium]
MRAVQIAAIVVCLAVTVVGVTLVTRTVMRMVGVIRLGQPALGRSGVAGARTKAMLSETLGHTRMLQWTAVGAAHWFVMISFGALFFTLVTAYGQLFDPEFALPLIGHWWPYEFAMELIAITALVSVVALIAVRLLSLPTRAGRKSRFAGSTMWQGYYVEWTILVILVCVLTLRGLEGALLGETSWNLHFPFSWPLVQLFSSSTPASLEMSIVVVAAIKILVSMAWFITIALNVTMGVAWHRFLAFPNIYFKREPQHGTALGPLQPMVSGGKPVDFEDPDEDDIFGVGKVEDFTWKGLLDFSTCTECGRCQSQCPAWNTGKPLSPKLLITNLRDHAYAKAPYLQAAEAVRADLPADVLAEAERLLVGSDGGVIDPEVLWSCTTCGACVEQCPVDIEHVDHIVDMRRFQVLIESSFPSEAGVMLRNIENKGNPWGMNASARNAWIDEVDFPIRVFGGDGEDTIPSDVEYLYWVGCAGALEDRAKKTTKAFAELLHVAGVEFMVLGEGESCTGDPARRIGNEFLFQMQAMQNVEVLNEVFGEAPVKRIVATCPHCFNTLANEYPQVGGAYEVIHHTQLLSKLVEEGRLTPVVPVDELVTYHDPCYLGRHNKVYTPPREVLSTVPQLRSAEMHRCKERGFCCGAGGARMWMEERIGKRINTERVDEALSLDPDTVATACPFCMVMLSDSVTAKKQAGEARDGVEVVDVAQLLLRSVKKSALVDGDDVTSEQGARPVLDTPDQTEVADYPQLAEERGDTRHV